MSEEECNQDEAIAMDLSDESEPEEKEIMCTEISKKAMVLAKWLTLFLLQLQTRFRMPDLALSALFSFLTTFLCILGLCSTFCGEIAKAFPRSLHMARGSFTEKNKFRRYVVCRKCHKLY